MLLDEIVKLVPLVPVANVCVAPVNPFSEVMPAPLNSVKSLNVNGVEGAGAWMSAAADISVLHLRNAVADLQALVGDVGEFLAVEVFERAAAGQRGRGAQPA